MCCVRSCVVFFFFFKQKTAYEMRISDWSSDVCSSDLHRGQRSDQDLGEVVDRLVGQVAERTLMEHGRDPRLERGLRRPRLERDEPPDLLDHPQDRKSVV